MSVLCSSNKLCFSPFPVRPFSPCLSVLPSDIQIGSGNVVTFTCSSQYTGPTVEYRFMRIWYSETSIRGSQDNDKFIIGDDSIGNDDGNYTCVVIVDGLESAVSTPIPLDVLGKIYQVTSNKLAPNKCDLFCRK